MNPLYLDETAVPAELVEKEREIYKAELAESKKPEEIMAKILDGKVQKYYSDICLLKQAFIKDESMTVEDVIKHGISKMGENIQMKRFVRFHLGQE
jgi:elongation factor Ts